MGTQPSPVSVVSAEERGATLQAKKQHRDEVRQKRREERLRAGASVAHSEDSSSASTSVADKQETDDLDMDLLAEQYVDQPRIPLLQEKDMLSMGEDDLFTYLPLPPESLPEAFPVHSTAPNLSVLPKSGCNGLIDEYEASGQHYIMYRPIIHFLKQWIMEEQEVSHYMLDGMPSSGKSIAMAALVHWARLSGWVALYIPNAEVLTAGGTFAYNKEKNEWDTPESAKYILHNLLAAHREALQGMRTVDGSRSLLEAAEGGLEATGAAAPVTAVLDVIEGLKGQEQVPVMLAVDRYNALYAPSGYGQAEGDHKRRILGSEELRLARCMRVLEYSAPLKGVSIAALARHDRISQRTPTPLPAWVSPTEVYRFSPEEWANLLLYYDAVGVCAQEHMQLIKSFILTQGNAKELRSMGELLSLLPSTAMYKDRK
ncbi:g4985 [Coccomyxa elongata]